MILNHNHNIPFRHLSSGSSRTAGRCRPEKTFLLVAAFAVLLMVIGGGAEVQHAVKLGQAVASDPAPYHLTGGAWSILDLSAPQSGYAFAQTSAAGAFITTWRTTTVNETITFPGVGTYTIDWGDESSPSVNVKDQQQHTYATAGNYTVSVSGNLSQISNSCYSDAEKLRSIEQWGNIRWSNMHEAFCGASQMTYNATDNPDLSRVSNMVSMFKNASVFNGDISGWDVSSVTNMKNMFDGARAFSQPLNTWNVSGVTDMSYMFRGASSFDQPLNTWNVSSVTNTGWMFNNADDFNQNINSWDVSGVTDMIAMFNDADAFDQPLDSWDVSSVTRTILMFNNADIFNQPLNTWNVSSVTVTSNMFNNADAFNQNLDSWDVSSVMNMNDMFSNTLSFNGDVSSWNVSSVTNMRSMFNNAGAFNQPLSDWDVSSVTNMDSMFSGADSFEQNLGNWYVVLDQDTIASTSIPGVVGTISAQNQPLKSHPPTYSIVDGPDAERFMIISGNQLNMLSGVPGTPEYSINVSASGDNVFESGNNIRLLKIKVTGQITDTDAPVIMLTGSTNVQLTIGGTYTELGADCKDDVDADKAATVAGDTVNTNAVGQYTVTYSCTDEAGNNAPQVSRTVNVVSSSPTFVSSELDLSTGVLKITFSETIDVTPATNIDVDKIYIRESGTYTGGVTLTASELLTAVDDDTISFILTLSHLETVKGFDVPELTIDLGAVRDTSNNLIESTFDVSTAVFVDPPFSVSRYSTVPTSMALSNDGYKMFVVGFRDKDISEYTLSAPFDVSTAMFVDAFPISQDTHLHGMAFSNNGSKMFVLGDENNSIYEYTLTIPFNITSATYANVELSVTGQGTEPTGMAFSNDGTKMFMIGERQKNINEYTLTIPFDLSTASFANVIFSVLLQDSQPKGVAFSNDGYKMFVVGATGDSIYKYTLTTPFDVSTAMYDNVAFSVTLQDDEPQGMAFSNDGDKMFVVGLRGQDINEYTLNSVYPISITDNMLPTFVSSELDTATGILAITFSEDIDATPKTNVDAAKIHVRESGTYTGGVTLTTDEVDTAFDNNIISFALTLVHQETIAELTTPELTIDPGAVRDTFGNLIIGKFDISTATHVRSFNITAHDESPSGIVFSNDGYKMFMVGGNGKDINEYTLTTPFDVSAVNFVDSFLVSRQDETPAGMAFSNDGYKMFVAGNTGGNINEYTLTIPFDVSTASYNSNAERLSVSAQDRSPTDIVFSNDGDKMFVLGNTGGNINEYTLTTPFDVSTASYDGNTERFPVRAQDTSPQGMAFSRDGYKMFMVGIVKGNINEYALTTPFDVSTARFTNVVFSVSGFEMFPQGMTFSNDGDKMFVVGSNSANVDEYALRSVYPISVTESTPPTFVLSELDYTTRDLTITFSEDIDVTPASKVDVDKIHIRESGNYTGGGITLSASKINTTVDDHVISFILTISHLEIIEGLTTPELTIEPGAVQDISGNPIIGTFDVSTATYNGYNEGLSVAGHDSYPSGIAFSNDGYKMFVVGGNKGTINEYALTTPFDVSTAEITHVFPLVSQSTKPRGMAFSNDGIKMFVTDDETDSIYEYNMSAPFKISTARISNSIHVYVQDASPSGLEFSNDGIKMFLVGSNENKVHEYTLTTPFVLSTATPSNSFSVVKQDTFPTGMAFSNDGDKMFVVGVVGQDINEYTLTTPFDVSTASYNDDAERFSVSGQDSFPRDIAFSNNGDKMFIVGNHGNNIHEYALNSVYPIVGSTDIFITTWMTTAPNEVITFPGIGTYTIDWGDGTIHRNVRDAQQHAYATADTYTVKISGDLEAINTSLNITNARKILSIEQWGNIEWTTMNSAFRSASSMVYNADDAPDLSGVTDMASMFAFASAFNGNISNWDVSSVTSMDDMFNAALVFNKPLSSWNVSSVTRMNQMFSDARAFNGNISSWDVSSVTRTDRMFSDAISFNQPLSSWNVSSVTLMFRMFASATAFNQDIDSWDVSSVDNTSAMFFNAAAFNGNISSWDVSSVDNTSDMFLNAIAFNGNISSWNVSSATAMDRMFLGATLFDQNLGNWYVVPADTAYNNPDGTLNVTTISAQNAFLDAHSPSYGIGIGGNSTLFNITDSNTLMFKSAQPADTYIVNVTASGDNVFESGNWRLLKIDVTGRIPDTESPTIHIIGYPFVTTVIGDTYIDAGATCKDDMDADKHATVGGNMINTNAVGQHTVTYSCTDEAGNSATQVSRIVNVEAPPPTFVSSEFDTTTGALMITFSEDIDVTPARNVDATKIHIREFGTYTGGVTMTASKLDTTVDDDTISFILTSSQQQQLQDYPYLN